MHLRLFLLIFLFSCLSFHASLASADVFITYGVEEDGVFVIELVEETPNQSVQLFVTGVVADGGSDGMELDVQIGDGGAFLGGIDTAPVIRSIDLITGTIWEAHGPNQSDVEDHPLARQSTVDTASLTTTDGLIGTLVFDTTGFGDGEIEFRLTGVATSFDTYLAQGTTVLNTHAPNGIIRIGEGRAIPEPSSSLVIALGMIGICVRRQKRSPTRTD